MNATIRPAIFEDALDIANVLQRSRGAFMPYAPLAHSEPEVLQWVRQSLIPSGAVTVACAGSQVVGVLATSSKAEGGWIDQLYLIPEFVGRGIGTRLLEQALCVLPRPVRLYTFQDNVRARLFYERNGFVEVQCSDGSGNEEHCPDVLYELSAGVQNVARAVALLNQEAAMYTGSCHCGAVRMTLPSKPEVATACNCSLCRRIGGPWVYFEFGTVKIVGHPEATAEYIQGDKTLRTIHCRTCGCVTHWEPLQATPGSKHGVNLGNFEPELIASVRVRRFDGANTWKFIDE